MCLDCVKLLAPRDSQIPQFFVEEFLYLRNLGTKVPLSKQPGTHVWEQISATGKTLDQLYAHKGTEIPPN
jgi:hypothetical protein